VRFAFATGWRTASEVLPLEWRHVDWQARTVRRDPGTTKNEAGRSFPFTAAIEKVVKDALGAQFDVRAFHDAILRSGRLPLDILERKLKECLNAPSCLAELRRP
jgi:integrase